MIFPFVGVVFDRHCEPRSGAAIQGNPTALRPWIASSLRSSQ
jgi:hypothetical protein